MEKGEFEEKFNELVELLDLKTGERININYMLGEHQDLGVRCEIWSNE